MRGRIRDFFRRSEAESLLLFNSERYNSNFFYFSGLRLDNSSVIARRDGGLSLIVNTINETEAEESGFGGEVLVWKRPEEFWGKMKGALAGCRSVAIDASSLSASQYNRAKRRLGKRLVDYSKAMIEGRGVKDDGELELIRKSVHIARKIVGGLEIRAGRTELGIAKELKIEAIERGCELSFEPIVVSGKKSAMPHGKPSEREIGKGEVLLVDYGVKYEGYSSDITRCFFTGECREEQDKYERLKDVFRELISGLGKGIASKEVPKECNRLMTERGLGKEMIHSPGHGIGLDVHEHPSLSKKTKMNARLANGMALAVEPAVYYPGKYGLRYEDDVLILNGKAKLF